MNAKTGIWLAEMAPVTSERSSSREDGHISTHTTLLASPSISSYCSSKTHKMSQSGPWNQHPLRARGRGIMAIFSPRPCAWTSGLMLWASHHWLQLHGTSCRSNKTPSKMPGMVPAWVSALGLWGNDGNIPALIPASWWWQVEKADRSHLMMAPWHLWPPKW